MAPAAQHHKHHDYRTAQSAEARHPSQAVTQESLSTTSPETKTLTETVTSTVFASLPIVSSTTFSLQRAPLHIAALVPGALPTVAYSDTLSLPLSHSPKNSPRNPPPLNMARRQPTHTLPQHNSPSRSRTSKYPRPSPPGFLHPSAIVPPTTLQHTSTHSHSAQQGNWKPPHHHASAPPNARPTNLLGDMDYNLAYLPPGLKFFFLASLAAVTLGVLWTGVVWGVSYRVGNWRDGKREERDKKGQREKRPLDKISKYAPRESARGDVGWRRVGARCETGDEERSKENGIQGIELRYRPHHRYTTHQQRGHPSPHLPESPPPQFTISTQHATTSRQPSPRNPFLDPPTNAMLTPTPRTQDHDFRKRTSREWLVERQNFFSSTPITSTVPTSSFPRSSHCTSRSKPRSISRMNEDAELDIEGLESRDAALPHHRHSILSSSAEEAGLLGKSLSWLDSGLEMVDGAVDGIVGRVMRWTDDGHGNGNVEGEGEGVLLPVTVAVARGK